MKILHSYTLAVVILTTLMTLAPLKAAAQDMGAAPSSRGQAAALSVGIGLGMQDAWGSDATNLDPGFAFRLTAEQELVPDTLSLGIALQYGTISLDIDGADDTSYDRMLIELFARVFRSTPNPALRLFGYGSIGYHKDEWEATVDMGPFGSIKMNDKDDGMLFSLGGGAEYAINDSMRAGAMLRFGLMTWDDTPSDKDDVHHWDLLLYVNYSPLAGR